MRGSATNRRAQARAAADEYVREQDRKGGSVLVPRRVTQECALSGTGNAEPHYLVYLTHDEIAYVLESKAADPSGVKGPQGLLCADPDKLKELKRGHGAEKEAVDSLGPAMLEYEFGGGRTPGGWGYYYGDAPPSPPPLSLGPKSVPESLHMSDGSLLEPSKELTSGYDVPSYLRNKSENARKRRRREKAAAQVRKNEKRLRDRYNAAFNQRMQRGFANRSEYEAARDRKTAQDRALNKILWGK